MREKRLKIVMAFYTTTDAMHTSALLKRAGIKGRLIPVPREISAGCGIAWCMEPEDYRAMPRDLCEQLPEAEHVVEIML